MKRKIIGLMLVAGLACTSALMAQALSVESAVEQALSQSFTIKSKQLAVDSALISQKDGVTNTFYPSLTTSATLSRSNEATLTKYPVSLATGITASLNLHPSMWMSLDLLKQQVASNQISLNAAQHSLDLQVRQLYYGIVVQNEALKLQQTSLKRVQDTLSDMEESYQNGLVAEINLIQLQNQIASQENAIKSSQSNIQTMKQNLNYLMGVDDLNAPLELIDAIPEIDKEALDQFKVDDAILSSTDLESLSLNEEMTDTQKKMQKSSMTVPSLNLSVSYMPVVSDITSDWSDYYDSGKVSATVAFDLSNLLPGSTAKTKIKTLENTQQSLEVARQQLVQGIHLTFEKNLATAQNAIDQIALAKKSQGLAKTTLDLTEQSYENGLTSYSSYKDAQLSLDQANLSVLQAKYTYLTALLDLQNEVSRNE